MSACCHERYGVWQAGGAMESDAVERIEPADAAEWRVWLEANHASAAAVWLVYRKKGSGQRALSWSEAVDEALCFGWIDSKVQPIDDLRYEQWFTVRKPTSVWSKINKEKIDRLLAERRIAPAGLAVIEAAKANGSWSILDDAENLVLPDDLAAALAERPGAADGYDAYPRSTKRYILQWLATAKRPETRAKRIAEAAEDAAASRLPKALRRP